MTLFILYRYPRDNTRQIQKTKSQHNKTGKRWKLANRRVDTKGIGIFWHIVTMYASFSPNLWQFSPQVQKRND
jgi:hypothetical protein